MSMSESKGSNPDINLNLAKSIQCYTDDWKRTDPDLVVYLPKERCDTDGYADHF